MIHETLKKGLKEFDELTEKVRDVIINEETSGNLHREQNGKKSINQWLKDNSGRHLFSNEVYGEPMLDLDEEKVKSHLTTTSLSLIDSVMEMVEGKKVAGGNYNCGEEGCCNPNPKDKRELEEVDWQAGYNQALTDLLSLLQQEKDKINNNEK